MYNNINEDKNMYENKKMNQINKPVDREVIYIHEPLRRTYHPEPIAQNLYTTNY